jgi:hypothetical protein
LHIHFELDEVPMPRAILLSKLFCIAVVVPLLLTSSTSAQQAGGVAPTGSTIRVVRAQTGAKGEARNGTFFMTEPRSTFYAPDDKDVIVYFEWEGSKGVHHCEGSVHGPNGEFATMSSFDYTATQPRFAGFWKVPLSEGTPPGAWTFESKVDGQAAGQLAFQVIIAARPTDLAKLRPLPTPAEIYAQAMAATVDILNLDSQGHLLRRSSGFLSTDGRVITSFHAIDGAANLRLHFANGEEISSPAIAAWDRHKDWVVFTIDKKSRPSLDLVAFKAWNVGDHCYWLDIKSDGSRILSDGQIVGLKSPSIWGDRIDVSGIYAFSAMGGPLLNERAEVIGVLGGALPESYVSSFMNSDVSEFPYTSISGIAVAINLVPTTFPSPPATLQDLWSQGLMIPPVAASKYVVFGMLTQGGSNKLKGSPVERVQKLQFRRSDELAGAWIHFSNSSSFKSVAALKLYDLDNRLVGSSKPEKVNVSRGELAERTWQLPLGNVPAGVYRIDLEMPEGVAWRQYFRLND